MLKRKYARLALYAAPVGGVLLPLAARAEGDATATVTGVLAGVSAFGPIMWAGAAVVVGIMIGVKWIKRARAAA